MLRLFLVLLWLATSVCHAQSDAWKLRRDEAGIAIYQQANASGYAVTRGETEIPASLDALLTLMRDTSACPLWVFACKEEKVVRQYNLKQRLEYAVIDSPLWFADRDMYVYSRASFDHSSRTFSLSFQGQENYDNGQAGRVRIRDLWGSWRLQQLAPDKTQLSYQLHGNPQLPASSLLDMYMVESVFQTLSNLRRLMQQDVYRNVPPIPELWSGTTPGT